MSIFASENVLAEFVWMILAMPVAMLLLSIIMGAIMLIRKGYEWVKASVCSGKL